MGVPWKEIDEALSDMKYSVISGLDYIEDIEERLINYRGALDEVSVGDRYAEGPYDNVIKGLIALRGDIQETLKQLKGEDK